MQAAGHVALDAGDGFEVEAVAVDHGFLFRVDAVALIVAEGALGELEGVAAVAAQAVEELGVFGGEALEEVGRGEGVGQGDAEVTVVDVDPVLHRHLVGHAVAVVGAVIHEPFVGVGTHGDEVVEHGQVDVRCAVEHARHALLEDADDAVLHLEREASSGAELRQLGAQLLEAARFGACAIVGVGRGRGARHAVIELGDHGHEGHLPEHGAIPQSAHFDLQSPAFLHHRDFGRVEAEALEEVEKDIVEVVASAAHEGLGRVRQEERAHGVHLSAQGLAEALGEGRLATVDEAIDDLRVGELLLDSVHDAEFVQIVVRKIANDHIYSLVYRKMSCISSR